MGSRTVEKILSDFTKTITELEERAKDLIAEVAKHEETIAKEELQKIEKSVEIAKATAVAKKLKDFLA
jgi:flagellar motility protein MotE (MotC chaperone)